MKQTEIKYKLTKFIHSFDSLWNEALADELVSLRYNDYHLIGMPNRGSYSTTSAYYNEYQKNFRHEKQLIGEWKQAPYLELPNFQRLSNFYEGHGLVPLTEEELISQEAVLKLKCGLKIIQLVPDCFGSVNKLISCIQVIASNGPEYDASYSHPDIPFSVFVSICEGMSFEQSIRVAEGILHEAMHLKLTLIQRYIKFVYPHTEDTYYSPWRGSSRPLMGVLHGIFVFRAIRDFFVLLIQNYTLPNQCIEHLSHRITDIQDEFNAVKDFPQCQGLTQAGRTLAQRLLQV